MLNPIIGFNDVFELLLCQSVLVEHKHIVQFDLATVVCHNIFEADFSVLKMITTLDTVILELASSLEFLASCTFVGTFC